MIKILHKLLYLKNKIFIDNSTKSFIKHNKTVWMENVQPDSNRVILMDCYGVAETEIARSYFANILAKKHHATIKSYSLKNLHYFVLDKLYKSFNVQENIISKPNLSQIERAKIIYNECVDTIDSKRKLHDYKIDDVWVGIDIYETYLARQQKPTPDFNDPILWEIFKEGIGLVLFWLDYFKKYDVKAVISSHDCYLTYNVVCKVAYKYNIPVYFPNPIYLNKTSKPFDLHSHFVLYRKLFDELPSVQKHEGIDWAKKRISDRLSGVVGVDMSYSSVSAFSPVKSEQKIMKESDNIKILICTHCFFDNPSGYGNTMFTDFYEWLCFLGEISNQTSYDWYLKMHPEPRPGTKEILDDILHKYPRITMLPYLTSHVQLAKEGLDFALTVYGSIGQEYPALGVQVINAGYNPRVGYDINWHPKNIDEYKNLLLNLKSAKKELNLNELYEFYFMHQKYIYSDDLLFDSYENYKDQKAINNINNYAYKYFLDRWSKNKHESIINKMEEFIDSNGSRYFSKGVVM